MRVETIALGERGFLGVELEPMPEQVDLPGGQAWRCSECGARLRSGPHIASQPVPHGTLQLLTRRRE